MNPMIPRNNIFIDGYSFNAYNTIGFGKIGENKDLAVKGTANMKAPNLSMKQWMGYFGSVSKLAPIPKDMKFGQIPEGVTRLGGTFIIKGEQILYSYEEGVPGTC